MTAWEPKGDLDLLPLDTVETGIGRGGSHRQGIDITSDNLIRPQAVEQRYRECRCRSQGLQRGGGPSRSSA